MIIVQFRRDNKSKSFVAWKWNSSNYFYIIW